MGYDAKTKPSDISVDDFINSVENETRRQDAHSLCELMKNITGDTPIMWGPSIIGFGLYHYRYDSGHEGDSMLVGFSPRKANLVLYVLGSLDDEDPLLEKLGKYKRGKACLYITRLQNIDQSVLKKIIKKSYQKTKKRWS
ncbi:DUF1801 domain-containing protein [Hyphococcus lacteus]|uniref:DUF1801 domain-containing protein n=1 Tax=Hyphococcus lacteus TaxID=3143536 RepID=A0ABV3Z561_9PROT